MNWAGALTWDGIIVFFSFFDVRIFEETFSRTERDVGSSS